MINIFQYSRKVYATHNFIYQEQHMIADSAFCPEQNYISRTGTYILQKMCEVLSLTLYVSLSYSFNIQPVSMVQ